MNQQHATRRRGRLFVERAEDGTFTMTREIMQPEHPHPFVRWLSGGAVSMLDDEISADELEDLAAKILRLLPAGGPDRVVKEARTLEWKFIADGSLWALPPLGFVSRLALDGEWMAQWRPAAGAKIVRLCHPTEAAAWRWIEERAMSEGWTVLR